MSRVQSLETARQLKLAYGGLMLNQPEALLETEMTPPTNLAREVPSPEQAILPVKNLLPSAVQATELQVPELETADHVKPPSVDIRIVPTPLGATKIIFPFAEQAIECQKPERPPTELQV